MKFFDTALPEVKRVELTIHRDYRGFFCEHFRADAWENAGIGAPIVQENHSRSLPHVLRGIHFQHTPAQGKLVGVVRGKVMDIAVDLRPHSPNFGKYVSAELSDENGCLLWVPPGFGHGFCVMGDGPADVVYHTTGYYNAAGEGGIAYNDPDIAIAWPIANPVVSERDRALPRLKEVPRDVLNRL
jgi:dTDP-4-dehydrorhamnose 3,5-epimerase